MNVHRVDTIESNGGAVDNKALGTALLACGAGTGAVWSVGSTVHTVVAQPVLSLGAIGLSAVTGFTGARMLIGEEFDKFFSFSNDEPTTVDISANPA